MLTSDATTATIAFFVQWVRNRSPEVRPAIIMTDCDKAQIAALDLVYRHSRIFLCTWHVLRAMRSHFVTEEFKPLWEKIKAWVTMDDLSKFYNLWDEITQDQSTPKSVIKYLTEWVQMADMWSRASRKNRYIFEEGDTNMLVEAYVIHFPSTR